MPMDIGPPRPRPFINKAFVPAYSVKVSRRAGSPRFNGNRDEVVCSLALAAERPMMIPMSSGIVHLAGHELINGKLGSGNSLCSLVEHTAA